MYKWIMAALLGVASVVGIVALINATAGNPSANPGEATPPPSMPNVTLNTTAAETIYKQSCVACHGDQLQGGIGMSLQKVGTRLSEVQIYEVIKNGRAAMPGFKTSLKDEDIANMSKWLEQHK